MTNEKSNEENESFPTMQELSLKELREEINHLEDGVMLLVSLNGQGDSVWT